MSDLPNQKPFEEGPLYLQDSESLPQEFADYLRPHDRDVEDAIETQNISDIADTRFTKFAAHIAAESFETQELGNMKKLVEILQSLDQDYGFDTETINELGQLPFEEAFSEAYSYITQAGLVAEEILVELLE